MHEISSYRDNRPTNMHPQTNPQTGPITIHCAAASAQCNKINARLQIGIHYHSRVSAVSEHVPLTQHR